jgi:hypothetical protein
VGQLLLGDGDGLVALLLLLLVIVVVVVVRVVQVPRRLAKFSGLRKQEA